MSRLFAQSALRAAVRDVTTRQPALTRSFSSLPTLRPGISAAAQPTTSIFARRPAGCCPLAFSPATTTTTTTIEAGGGSGGIADVVPRSAITSHPALAGIGSQIRCGPRRYMNMNRPSRLIRMRRHGFLGRLRTKTGRKMLQRRKTKGRLQLSA